MRRHGALPQVLNLLVTCYIWAGWIIDEVVGFREFEKESLDIEHRTFIL